MFTRWKVKKIRMSCASDIAIIVIFILFEKNKPEILHIFTQFQILKLFHFAHPGMLLITRNSRKHIKHSC